jgi:hypothetical protein
MIQFLKEKHPELFPTPQGGMQCLALYTSTVSTVFAVCTAAMTKFMSTFYSSLIFELIDKKVSLVPVLVNDELRRTKLLTNILSN